MLRAVVGVALVLAVFALTSGWSHTSALRATEVAGAPASAADRRRVASRINEYHGDPLLMPSLHSHSQPPPPPKLTLPPSPSPTFRLPQPPSQLTLTFGTVAAKDYVYNWLQHARKLGRALRPYAAVALDRGLLDLAQLRWGEPVLSAHALLMTRHATNSEVLAAFADLGRAVYARNHADRFRQLGYLKALTTARLLELGYDVLLSDADAVFLADPWPWIGRVRADARSGVDGGGGGGVARSAGTGSAGALRVATDAGELPTADVLATNDLPDLRRDGQPDSVYNTGVTFFRASSGRALHFVLEWANRTLHTAIIGNDQTEFNRLLRNRYSDDASLCNRPECLLPDPQHFIPAAARFQGPGCGERERERAEVDEAESPEADAPSLCGECRWLSEPSKRDGHTGLMAVDTRRANAAWLECQRRMAQQYRTPSNAARRVYWMWGGRVRFGLLPMDRFLQGSTFFVQRLHVLRRVAPIHVHITYTMGSDFGKRWRLRSAGLWHQPRAVGIGSSSTGEGAAAAALSFAGGHMEVDGLRELLARLLDSMDLSPEVWKCMPPSAARGSVPPDQPSSFFGSPRAGGAGDNAERRCYHPKHVVTPPNFEQSLDPAAPHIAVQYVSRLVIRNALALAYVLGRSLVLPRLWALCERHWWQLVDCRIPGIEYLPMPYEAPYDLLFNMDNWHDIQGVSLAATSSEGFEAAGMNVSRPAAARLHVKGRAGGEVLNAKDDKIVKLPAGSTFDSSTLKWELANQQQRLVISASSLLRFSTCGFESPALAEHFQKDVLRHVFAGQYSYCGEERNPHVPDLLAEAKARGIPEEKLLITRRNCTGQPANAFNKPKIDLGSEALAFELLEHCAGRLKGELWNDDVDVLQHALSLVRIPARKGSLDG